MLAGVRFYQAALRPLNPWACKFHPSCSSYTLEAVERYGLRRGGWLALTRLLRCRPGVFGGYDPVPLDFAHPSTLLGMSESRTVEGSRKRTRGRRAT